MCNSDRFSIKYANELKSKTIRLISFVELSKTMMIHSNIKFLTRIKGSRSRSCECVLVGKVSPYYSDQTFFFDSTSQSLTLARKPSLRNVGCRNEKKKQEWNINYLFMIREKIQKHKRIRKMKNVFTFQFYDFDSFSLHARLIISAFIA